MKLNIAFITRILLADGPLVYIETCLSCYVQCLSAVWKYTWIHSAQMSLKHNLSLQYTNLYVWQLVFKQKGKQEGKIKAFISFRPKCKSPAINCKKVCTCVFVWNTQMSVGKIGLFIYFPALLSSISLCLNSLQPHAPAITLYFSLLVPVTL